MKRGLLVILLAGAGALGGYAIYFRCATAGAQAMLAQPGGEMEWLRREFHLTDAQFARIRDLHRGYAPKCGLMCAKIADANARLDTLIDASGAITPEIAAALQESAAVQEECRQALLGHVYAVAAEMPPADGARYRRMMKARLIQPGMSSESVISESAK